MNQDLPSLQEVTLGVFLHDIGKFMQRAHDSLDQMDPNVRARADHILPQLEGRRTHWHALWTDAFFEALAGVAWPGVRQEKVRDIAVYHHAPSPNIPLTELAAEADRLSAGMDRKERDEVAETASGAASWRSFIETPLTNPFAFVDLQIGCPQPPPSQIPLGELIPDRLEMPQPQVATERYPADYRILWNRFLGGFRALCQLPTFDLFSEALLWLSERFTFAIPSSTQDQPDIPLHDHSRTAAAIAAALYRWHEHDDSLTEATRIRDRSLAKFRFLAGDLSGIQRALFRLAAEQVQGLSKILRARSLLIALSAEAAALAIRRRLGLPVFSLLQNAGGRFLLLVPNREDVTQQVEKLRQEINDWYRDRYYGELVLNLALSAPFSGAELEREKFPALLDSLAIAVEHAKLRPLISGAVGGIRPLVEARYPGRACACCGVRPAQADEPGSRCVFCEQEHELGGALPRLTALRWMLQPSGRIRFFAGLALEWDFGFKRPSREWLSAFRLYRPGEADGDSLMPVRFLGGYVPRLETSEVGKPAYTLLSREGREVRPGELKTFEHIALDAVELVDGELRGEALLAAFKADVDRLGFIFSDGLRDRTLSRFASLSRMLDFFFAGYLPELLRREFPSIYTVYAGGDDMLLIGPWRQTLKMAERLREQFRAWTGGNPNITFSAGIELFKPNHPVGPAVARAEERLDAAKRYKDRVSAITEHSPPRKHSAKRQQERRRREIADIEQPVPWQAFARSLEDAEQLNRWFREDLIHAIFLHRLLYFADQRRRAEGANDGVMDLKAADWPARWGYYLARHIERLGEARRAQGEEIRNFANRLLGLDRDLSDRLRKPEDRSAFVSPRLAVTIALLRNRSAQEQARR